MCPVALLSHVPVHVLEPVHPALELDQVRRVRLHSQVHGRLRLVDDDGKPVLVLVLYCTVFCIVLYCTCTWPEQGYHRGLGPRTVSGCQGECR